MQAPQHDDQPVQVAAGSRSRSRHGHYRIIRLIRARVRTFLAALTMIAIWVVSGALWQGALSDGVRFLVAWNVGAILWLAMTVVMMARSDPARMRKRSAEQDEGAALILLVSCAASTACLVAIASVLGGATGAADVSQSWRIGLGVLTIVSAWLFMHMTFTLHYAHAWYEPDGGDLLFPDKDVAPDYFDFAYFSLTMGVACQTADVAIRSKRMRRVVTVQAVLAFFFNAAVLALGVNVAASVVGAK